MHLGARKSIEISILVYVVLQQQKAILSWNLEGIFMVSLIWEDFIPCIPCAWLIYNEMKQRELWEFRVINSKISYTLKFSLEWIWGDK